MIRKVKGKKTLNEKLRYNVIYGKLFALAASCQQYEVNKNHKET